jgi:hypothetical protein
MKFICILPLFCQNALNEHPELHASVWASELQGVERGSEVIAHLLQRSWGSSAEKLSIYCREVCDFLCSCFLLINKKVVKETLSFVADIYHTFTSVLSFNE